MKLMRNFEEGEKEARVLRQRVAGQETLAKEKEAVQASSEFREVSFALGLEFGFTLIHDISPSCLVSQPVLPKSHLPLQNWAAGGAPNI